MRRFPAIIAACAVLAVCGALSPEPASAREYVLVSKTWRVQVKYQFSDTDAYLWRTYYKTNNSQHAWQVYDILNEFQEAGVLNDVLTGGDDKWRAVDVRITGRTILFPLNP